ncbi:RcnB family protein [Agrobacterium rosae]|uniref:RcnB family protein n=1 Tax=Agrobacterium rosae TaxID=1972867 RepID=A0AAW9FG00_9HYPH|nr:RcnB family protein [Agrobacterium rosae]MDX8304476.1 RcnB family protein [Agrobacterium rosae]
MKRLIITSLSASLLIVPMAHAQQQPRSVGQQQEKKAEQAIKKTQWKRGDKLPSPGRHSEFRDYRKQGLRAPGKGQRWVLVDRQYLLVAAATGAILSVASGR